MTDNGKLTYHPQQNLKRISFVSFVDTTPRPKILYHVPKILCSLVVVYIRDSKTTWNAGVCNADLVGQGRPRLNRCPNKLPWFGLLWCHNSPLDACPFDLCIHVGSWKEEEGRGNRKKRLFWVDVSEIFFLHKTFNVTNVKLRSSTLRLLPEEVQRKTCT